jgi:hypothetical protein
MRTITRMLLASVLAIGASSFAGCGDMADCPSTFSAGGSCTAAGLSCTAAAGFTCTCTSGVWASNNDLPFPLPRDMSTRDLPTPTD